MYSFFNFASETGGKVAALASALTLSAVLMATAILPASPSNPLISGVIA
ncbi:MAG: hypothetical protein AAGL10_05000 [Pseudomonadota bacterium]